VSHYEEACKKACQWCAEGRLLIAITGRHIWDEFPGNQVDEAGLIGAPCTAPDRNAWGEQQAEALREARTGTAAAGTSQS
jgi:hypothetical protein